MPTPADETVLWGVTTISETVTVILVLLRPPSLCPSVQTAVSVKIKLKKIFYSAAVLGFVALRAVLCFGGQHSTETC